MSINDYKEEWDNLPMKKNLRGNEALHAVKQNGFSIRYVKEQTPEICLESVKQNGYSLRFIKEQTPEICLEAVKQNGNSLQYVKEQTKEICLEAVKQDGNSLQYVSEDMFYQNPPEIVIDGAVYVLKK